MGGLGGEAPQRESTKNTIAPSTFFLNFLSFLLGGLLDTNQICDLGFLLGGFRLQCVFSTNVTSAKIFIFFNKGVFFIRSRDYPSSPG